MKEIQLRRPSDHELDDAYRQLSKGGSILIEIDPSDLSRTLQKLEEIGFVGIEMPYYKLEDKWITVTGFKGKHGPCYNTGIKAKYIGSAKAAFDDDNHLLIKGKESAICDKTSIIYRFSPYRDLISMGEASHELSDRLESVPAKFDLYSLDDEFNILYDQLKDVNKALDRIPAFYPGPFKSLILGDGTIINRGEVNSVPESDLEDLVRNDRFTKIKTDSIELTDFFQNEYIIKGSRCLQMDHKVVEYDVRVRETDLNELDLHSMKVMPRLMRLIEQDRKYFILTGSDPADEMGCCPSDEVGEANRLVEAGILSALTQDVYGDACPVTYYAFKDEIFVQNEDIQFKKNTEIRKRIYRLSKKSGYQRYRPAARWILLVFVFVSLVFALLRISDKSRLNEHFSFYEQLSVTSEDAVLILLFHNRVRCTMCLNMEAHIQSMLSGEYAELVKETQIQLFLMDMNKPENKSLIDRFGLYTASVVIVNMVDREESDAIILKDIWQHHEDGNTFKDMVADELGPLLNK